MGSNLCRFKKRRVFLIIIGSPMKIIVLCEVHNPGVTWVIFGGTCWVVLSTKRWKNWGFHYRKQGHELQRLNWYPSVMFLPKKPCRFDVFFARLKKKNTYPTKKHLKANRPSSLVIGFRSFSIRKIPRKDERGAFLDILEVDPKNAQALRQNLDLKKLQKKNKQDMVQGGPLDML